MSLTPNYSVPLDRYNSDELTSLATLYYIDGLTQEELSKKFGVSRATVGRMLRRAQNEGIVEIRVRQSPKQSDDVERALVQRFGILRAILTPDHADPEKQRGMLASLVAGYLDKTLQDGMIVAVGMGRNINAVSDHAISTAPRECAFVCAIGGTYQGGEAMNPDHIARRLAAQFGGQSETLYAPALMGSPEVARQLSANPTVRQTLDKARRADLALVGVGDMSADSNMVRMGWFSPSELAEAKRIGTVGDLMGYDFLDIHGRSAATQIQGRVVGLSVNDLKRIPNVIAMASEPSKVTAILGALRTGAINTLATSVSNATTLLQMEDAINIGRQQIVGEGK
ncbi:sugar-binding transcriptional regulator [Deinococcus marmoris]|uniref:Transcriptional regulator of sorbose uptake and utilization n=1 Tax=Deinococcus marmoris TaxID=249408 RepID=A0A1U7NT82_9DEIO|nr:sugar-binding transcriptional regulator [Deinococcus marmoris]OLV16122.1 transcriptional regulator of sorbose uptake and utilization [Deinococcus marmoris]